MSATTFPQEQVFVAGTETMRHYGNMRFTISLVYIGLVAGFINAFYATDKPLPHDIRVLLCIWGVLLTIGFGIGELMVTSAYERAKSIVAALETQLNIPANLKLTTVYGQHGSLVSLKRILSEEWWPVPVLMFAFIYVPGLVFWIWELVLSFQGPSCSH